MPLPRFRVIKWIVINVAPEEIDVLRVTEMPGECRKV
jgi:hypothetical protein